MAVSDRTTGTGESVARWGRQSQSVGQRRIGWLKPWSCAIYMLLNGGVESGVGVVKVINVTSTGECGGSGVYRHPSRPLCLVIDGLCCCVGIRQLLAGRVNGLLIGWMDVFLCTFIDIIVLEDIPNEDWIVIRTGNDKILL